MTLLEEVKQWADHWKSQSEKNPEKWYPGMLRDIFLSRAQRLSGEAMNLKSKMKDKYQKDYVDSIFHLRREAGRLPPIPEKYRTSVEVLEDAMIKMNSKKKEIK